MQIIQKLQSSRPEIVHLFDEFVNTIPEGVFFTSITQKGRDLNIQGVAQSNARVSTLMRQMDASDYLANPALVEIVAGTQKIAGTEEEVRLSRFQLNIKQEDQKKAEEEGDKSS